jgi:hypothetical protein
MAWGIALFTNNVFAEGENMDTKIKVIVGDEYAKKVNRQINWTRLPNVRRDSSIAARVDQIAQHCADKLGIQFPVLQMEVFIYDNKKILRERSLRFYPDTSKTPDAYYVHAEKTIYCSADTISDRKLAHEIGHALIDTYFVIPVPRQISEVLCVNLDKTLGDK